MIKKTLKKKLEMILMTGFLIPSLLLSEGRPAIAKESHGIERKLILDFANPLSDFEANSKLKYSLNQLSGRGIDYLNKKAGKDSSLIERFGILSLATYISNVFEVISHEGGHIREGKRYGETDYNFKLNSFLQFGKNFPKEFEYYPTDKQLIKSRVAGLNQDEYNSYVLFKNSREDLTFDNGLSFLLAKFFDVEYNLSSNAPEGINDISINDVKEYIRILNKRGINLSKKDYLLQSLIADLLSVQTWDSVNSIFNYLKTGRESIKTTTFKISGVKFTPPLINQYLTPNGSFYNITSFINPNGNRPIEINVGTDVDFIGGGKVKSLRLGGKYYGLKLWNSEGAPRLNPFAHLDFNRDNLKIKGYSIGADISIPIKDNFELTGKFEYNKDDMLENTIKGKNNGYRAVFGFSTYFN